MSKDVGFPSSLPSAALLPHMSARYRHEIADVVFQMTGGVERLVHEVNRTPDAYWTFITKVWAKGLPRISHAEIAVSDGVEDLLEKLDERDRAENAKVINGTARPVDTTP